MSPDLKITNETSYSLRDLRKFFLAGCKEMFRRYTPRTPYRHVRVAYSKKNTHWGQAQLRSERPGISRDGSNVLMTIPKGKLDIGELARVFEHEMLHTFGVRHGEMTESQLWCKGPTPAWAEGMVISLREPKKVTLQPADKAKAKLEHAIKMRAKHEREVKHHALLLKKWEAKVKYHTRRISDLTTSPDQSLPSAGMS